MVSLRKTVNRVGFKAMKFKVNFPITIILKYKYKYLNYFILVQYFYGINSILFACTFIIVGNEIQSDQLYVCGFSIFPLLLPYRVVMTEWTLLTFNSVH